MSRKVLEIDNVTFSYRDNKKPVLKNVSIQVDEQDFLAIIGPNGGGKTTLVKLIIGELTPDTGTIKVFDSPTCMGCHNIGYVPQFKAFERDFPITVLEAVLMGRLKHRSFFGGYSKQDRDAAHKALDTVRLTK